MTVQGAIVEWLADEELADRLAGMRGRSCRVTARSVLQQRLVDGQVRIVEWVTLQSGEPVIVKSRNDRVQCREALFYRHVLHRASGLVPGYWGDATTASGEHILVLEYLEGRAVDWSNSHDRALALGTLARFHLLFEGSRVEELLPPAPPELLAEATPVPIDAEELAAIYRDSVSRVRSLLVPGAGDRLMRAAGAIIRAMAAEPLVLDPGDVRPENVLLLPDRAVLLDFENIGIRRRGMAAASLLINVPGPMSTLAPYWAELQRHSRFPRAREEFCRSVRASRIWLLLRSLPDAAGLPGACSECLRRVQGEVAHGVMEFS